jgi:hypothetical protein
VEQSSSRTVRAVGTLAAVIGFGWLVSLGDKGYDEWRFLAATLMLGGLLLRIEAAVAGKGL